MRDTAKKQANKENHFELLMGHEGRLSVSEINVFGNYEEEGEGSVSKYH